MANNMAGCIWCYSITRHACNVVYKLNSQTADAYRVGKCFRLLLAVAILSLVYLTGVTYVHWRFYKRTSSSDRIQRCTLWLSTWNAVINVKCHVIYFKVRLLLQWGLGTIHLPWSVIEMCRNVQSFSLWQDRDSRNTAKVRELKYWYHEHQMAGWNVVIQEVLFFLQFAQTTIPLHYYDKLFKYNGRIHWSNELMFYCEIKALFLLFVCTALCGQGGSYVMQHASTTKHVQHAEPAVSSLFTRSTRWECAMPRGTGVIFTSCRL